MTMVAGIILPSSPSFSLASTVGGRSQRVASIVGGRSFTPSLSTHTPRPPRRLYSSCVRSQIEVKSGGGVAVLDAALNMSIASQYVQSALYIPQAPPKEPISWKKLWEEAVESAAEARCNAVNAVISMLYKAQDQPNRYFLGNYGPVKEVGEKVAVKVVEGAIPTDFPAGMLIRNGPNPQFDQTVKMTPLGKTLLHWFEGDGMLHATYFEKDGSILYKNKFVETEGYKEEKRRRQELYLGTFIGGSLTIFMNYVFNILRFGLPHKSTANTSVTMLSGRLFANIEHSLPIEIDPTDLSSLGPYDCNGEWDILAFTAHPKIDVSTGEMVMHGTTIRKFQVGVISADGSKMLNKVSLPFDRDIISHDIAITARYNVILDLPITVDLVRQISGGRIIEFDENSYARIGVMPRYGDAESVRWFNVKVGCVWHVLNAYEEGDEVVLHAERADVDVLESTFDVNKYDVDSVPGPLEPKEISRIYEWRMNMATGEVRERALTDLSIYLEMGIINTKYTGRKNDFAYLSVLNVPETRRIGMPVYNKFVKADFSAVTSDNYDKDDYSALKLETHDMGPNIRASEPTFIARPFLTREDDGWLAFYVHDEATNQSEVRIVDCEKFEEGAVARISLPQRVPYGFHGTFLPSP